jgi:hypothetical protein
MSQQTRSKEAKVQITKNGERLGTSMLLITDFSWDPEAEIKKTRYVGDKRSTPDLDVMGVAFSFKTHTRDHVWMELWDEIQRAEELGQPAPDISLSIVYAYRNGARGTVGLHGELVLKLDKAEVPQNDYLANSWSGYCQYADNV